MTPGSKPRYNPQKNHRKSIRLKGYNYAQSGAYFVTIVAYQRECLFGTIVDGESPQGSNVALNDFGAIADECWRAIPEHFDHVELGAYVVMPNHVHGIIVINQPIVGARHASPLHDDHPRGPKPGSLGAIVGSYKSAVTRRIGREFNATGIWQRNYHDRIIRNEREMENIWRYINANPLNWDSDNENPNNL